MRKLFSKLFSEFADQSNISILENQWRKLLTLDWKSIFPHWLLPNSKSEFCMKAINVKSAGGNLVLKDSVFLP